jgi:hypothetical protein
MAGSSFQLHLCHRKMRRFPRSRSIYRSSGRGGDSTTASNALGSDRSARRRAPSSDYCDFHRSFRLLISSSSDFWIMPDCALVIGRSRETI